MAGPRAAWGVWLSGRREEAGDGLPGGGGKGHQRSSVRPQQRESQHQHGRRQDPHSESREKQLVIVWIY